MSNTHLTQCPHCQATFKVQDQHLNAAGGKVRCGSCLEVFNALESLIEPTQAKTNLSSLSKPAAQPQNTSTEVTEPKVSGTPSPKNNESTDDNSTNDDELVFADNPDEDSEDDGYTGPGTFSSELSDSFLELGEGGENHFSAHELKDSLDESISSKKAGSDESWAEQMLEDIATNTASKDEQPSPSNEPLFSAEFAALDQEAPSNQSQGPSTDNSQDGEPEATSHSNPDSFDQNRSQPYASTGLSHQYQNLQADPLDLPRASDRSFLGTCIWTIINLGLLITLLAQLAWFHYDKLARFDQLRPLYEQGCQLVGCKLPDLVDTTKIKSQNLIVRSHPTARKALIIDAVIVNQAPFDQPFPNLALYFSDLNNNIIAQRLFEPTDYVAGEIKHWSAMPKGTPIHISIEILDPGKNAVNYSVGFFKHTPQN